MSHIVGSTNYINERRKENVELEKKEWGREGKKEERVRGSSCSH
jgi:hypothetical protein